METVRLSFVKKEFLVKHSDTLHLVERSSVFSLCRYDKKGISRHLSIPITNSSSIVAYTVCVFDC